MTKIYVILSVSSRLVSGLFYRTIGRRMGSSCAVAFIRKHVYLYSSFWKMHMKKIFLCILIIISGLKIVSDSGGFTSPFSVVKVPAEDEESKNEKESNQNNKRAYEETYLQSLLEYCLSHISGITTFLRDDKPHSASAQQPNTPPPDSI